MPNFLMKYEWAGNPEVPFESRYCPQCNAINWAAGRNPVQIGPYEADAIHCWNCDTVFPIDGYGNDVITDPAIREGCITCVGVPDPVVPTFVLQNLVDAAEQQVKEMQEQAENENDPLLHEIVAEVVKSVQYVKDLIGEGKVGKLVAPI